MMSCRHLLLATCCATTACANDPGSVSPANHFTSTVQVDGELLVNSGRVKIIADENTTTAPELRWFGANGEWVTGIDTSSPGGPRDLVLASKAHWPTGNQVDDLVYVAHNGERAPTVGIGVTPPDVAHRLQLSAQDTEPEMGTLQLRRSAKQTGNLVTAIDSAGIQRWTLDADFWLKGAHPAMGSSLAIKADDTNQRPLVFGRADGTTVYGFQYANDASGSLFLRYFTGGFDVMALHTDGHASFPHGLATTGLRVEGTAVPASSTSPCTRGDISYDDNFIYVCIAQNTWKRSSLGSW